MDEKVLFGRAARIKMLILDVDGVLTDGGIILDNEGNELKAFYVRDGHGLKMLTRAGTQVAVITLEGTPRLSSGVPTNWGSSRCTRDAM